MSIGVLRLRYSGGPLICPVNPEERIRMLRIKRLCASIVKARNLSSGDDKMDIKDTDARIAVISLMTIIILQE